MAKKTFILLGHAQSGKTTIGETLIYKGGANNRLGSVDDGSSILDYNDDEKERKSSINTSVASFKCGNDMAHMVDVPGYTDFWGETLCAVKAVDFAVVAIDAVQGIEIGTENSCELLDQYNLPRIFFVNKLDKENTDYAQVVKSLQDTYGKKCAPIAFPQGKASSFKDVVNILSASLDSLGEDKDAATAFKNDLIESIAEADDKLLEKYLESGELSEEEIKNGISKAILFGKLYPICCGSAAAEKGTDILFEVIEKYAPKTEDRGSVKGKDPQTQEEKERKCTTDDPFSAFVFKSFSDPYIGQLNVFRVYSGTLNSNSGFYNINKGIKERIGQIYILVGKEQKAVDKVEAGDIAALAKLKDTGTNDTLCDEKDQVIFEETVYPEPLISLSVKPKSRGDEEKISQALARTTTEDPTFVSHRDTQTKELIVSGAGDLHINVMIKRIQSRFGVEVDLGTPKVPYKETITKKTRIQYKHKKQSGGRGQYGDCVIEIEPLERGKNFEFIDKIFGGAIPKNYIPSVEKGVVNAMKEGAIAGYPIVDVKVTLVDGSYHDVDSSDMAFQIAGAMALKKGVAEAGPALIEPIMNVEVLVPGDFMGQISGDLNSRRGRIMGMDSRGKNEVVKAQVPLAEMFTYANELRSMTQGRGFYTMKFSHYEQVPHKVAQPVIDAYKKSKSGEEE